MLITDSSLDIFVGQGNAFESLLHSLIRAEARVCGISPDQIDWDYRTNVPDGGRDILIRVGSSNNERQFIPSKPSVWSAKSGADGLKPTTLHKEVVNHPKILEHLKEGGVYVWCTVAPASNEDVRDNLRKEATELAKTHDFNPDQIHFIFRDSLTSWLNQQIGIASIYLQLPRGWKTLDEWKKRDKNFNVPWVDFGARSELKARILEHLLGLHTPNVLHLAGWSGIGKTRTALETCLQESSLEGALYFPTLESFTKEAEDYFLRNDSVYGAIIIDEVKLEEWSELRSRVSDYANRIRIVTIGSGTKEELTSRYGILEVPEPSTSEDVTGVIRSAEPTLTSEQASLIADWSEHDLRLALLLVEANRQDPSLTNQPISSVEDVWKRVLNLFSSEIGDINSFRDIYGILSVSIDVGNVGEPRKELEYLAMYFGKPEADLDRVIAQAISCGLGRQQGRYFEAVPRALARRIFERFGWPLLKSTATKFIAGMPRLRTQKRFVERGHECSAEVRKQIAAALSEWFHEQFPAYEINRLLERQASQVFSAYAELNPELGLAWLQRAVERASPEELLSFDARTDSSGFWRGRRQVVWLCEHLAQFPEYFWKCEAILFRLGLHENEERTSNNSQGVWQRFFRPMFSWTAVPFEERLKHLLRRLKRADVQELPIIIGALLGAIKEPTGEVIPPHIVGGRLAPEEWHPKTDAELRAIRINAAKTIIQALKELPEIQLAQARSTVVEHLSLFLSLDCLDELEGWLRPEDLDDEILRQLRTEIDSHLDFLSIRADGSNWLDIHPPEEERRRARKALDEITIWRRTLDPKELDDRIKEVTGRAYWQHKEGQVEERQSETDAIYENLAKETLENSEVLDGLSEWFNSDKANSAFEFGQALGRLDSSGVLLERMFTYLTQGHATNLLTGYLEGIVLQLGFLPPAVSKVLDVIGPTHPVSVIIVTLNCDVSDEGFERLLQLVLLSGPNPSVRMQGLWLRGWSEKLSVEQKGRALELMLSLGKEGDVWAYKIALDLVKHWSYKVWDELPEPVSKPVADILEACLEDDRSFDEWDWTRAVKRLHQSHAKRRIELLVQAITSRGFYDVKNNSLSMLSELAREHPEDVMRSVGRRALAEETKWLFWVNDYRGLFEAIGLDTVSKWIKDEGGVIGARAIARHVGAPVSLPDNPTYVPPLTEWLLSEFEDDDQVFEQFCLGRNSGQVYVGPIRRYFEGTEERVNPFLNHPLRRVREWAEYEIAHAKGISAWDMQREAEFGRE